MSSRSQTVSTFFCLGSYLFDSRKFGAVVVLLIASLQVSGLAIADERDTEIGGFHFTDISGSASVKYLLDDRERSSVGAISGFESQSSLEADLFVLTRSYLYHPDFIDMIIGGGPLLVTQEFDSTPGSNSANEALFNFTADLKFLSRKAYPVRTYFKRSHPSVSTSLSGRFLIRRTDIGLNAQLREPVSPVQFTLDVFRIETIGSGLGASLDETIDEISLNAFKSYRDADRVSLTYRWNQRDSLSGSPGLPIQSSLITTKSTDIDARNVFGADGEIEFVQQLFLIDQDTELDVLTTLQDQRYFGNLNWRHTRSTRSFYQYRDQATDRPGQSNVSHRALVVGGSHERGQNLLLDATATVSEDQDTAFNRQLAGIRSNVKYLYPTSFGQLSVGAGLGVRRTDQVAEEDQAQVFDEAARLTGNDLIELRSDFVIRSTVIVRNEPKTQVFVEGMDYRLVIVGGTTSIQRLVGGNITDGQPVLMDYSYLTGGTVEFDTLSQNFVVDVRFLNYFSAFARLSKRDNKVVSGAPVIPLNDVRSIQLGGRLDYPIASRWRVGGEYLYTDQDEEISSYVRNSIDAYIEVILPWASSMRIMLHQEVINNEGSTENVDLVQYRVSLRSRPLRGIMLSWDSDYLEDVGGSLFRERTSHNLSVQWMYRQMRMILRGEVVSETLGATVRDNTRITAQIQRAF